MHRDGIASTLSKVGLAPVVINTDTTTSSIIIDTLGYESLKVSLFAGVVTTGDIVISSMSESADSGMSGSSAVPAARLIGTLAATAVDTTNELASVGVVTHYRYVQYVITSANSCNMLASSIAELGHAQIASD